MEDEKLGLDEDEVEGVESITVEVGSPTSPVFENP